MIQKLLFILVVAVISAAQVYAQKAWPRIIPLSDGSKLTMYEPQPESMSGNQLKGRAAVSVRKSDSDEPTFGVIFFDATVDNSATNEISSMKVTQAKFNGADQNLADNYAQTLEKNIAGTSLGMSTKDIQDAVDRENAAGAEFNNSAPKIIYSSKPSTLITIDGEPKVSYDKNLDAEKVVNSPNLIFKDGNQWNLYAGGNWYKSNSITGKWSINNRLSAKVKKVNEAVKKQEKENNKGEELTSSPRETEIIVASEPTELLQSDGEPQYKNVAGTSLLYVSNSPNEIFKDVNTQNSYILVAGRWYSSPDMRGSWKYVPSDKLPEDFAKIPAGSDKDRVLASVAGTEAAEDARVNAALPQTAKVDKRTATINVQYDGTPVFNQIDGTSLELAENANVTVMIDASGNYFALDNGVWFISQSAYGPWRVANDRPRDVDDIPASSPAYNSKYVYVYDDGPDYVYMGYTPGYLGSYYYGPTVVYGTGWHYRPWYRTVYYPRPVTWGFGFMYDPWIGWNINWGFNFGYLYVGFNYGYPAYGYAYGGGWFGPHYYCPPYRRHYYGGYYGRGDYYGYNNYGYRNRDRYNNGYGYANGNGSRPNRRPGGVTPPSQNPGSGWTRNYNLYNNQRGATSQAVTRNTRVYRPQTQTTANFDRNRITPANRNNRVFENNFDNSVSDNPRTTPRANPRQPVVTSPGNAEQRPVRETPSVSRPSGERPEPIHRQQVDRRMEPVQRPQGGDDRGARQPRVEQPQPGVDRGGRQPRVEQPRQEQQQRVEQPRQQVDRPQRNYSVPSPQRQERSAPAPRVERPSGGGGNSGSVPRGRPDRR